MSREHSKIREDEGCGDYCFCTQKPKKKDKFKTSENQLQNWEKWMRRRSLIHNKLARPLGRPVDELVMNMGDEYRNIMEEREVFYYTNLETHFDKLRGNPEFWKLPVGLVDRCDGRRDPIYFAVKTKFEKNEIPPIEYVRNSNYILNEKNVLTHTRKLYALWKKSKYRNAQMQALSSKVNLIEPHKPECEKLIIVGEKIGHHSKATSIESQSDRQEERLSQTPTPAIFSHTFNVRESPKLCFSINGITFSQHDALVNETVKIRLLFECAANLKVPVVEHLKFENKGLTTLRFYWNRIEKFRIFRNLTQCDSEECQEFYFNKNELLLVPGETNAFPVWFKAKKVGIYTQFWKITTLPKIWGDDFELIILLHGIVHVIGFEKKAGDIKQMLEVRARNTLIKDLLRSTLENLKYTETEATTFVFSEKQHFESVNQEIWWGAEKRPKYLYDQNIVNELKEFYLVVKPHDYPLHWNFSVRDLQIITRKKDISDYVESKASEAINARYRRTKLKELKIEPQVSQKAQGAKEKSTPPPTAVPEHEEADKFVIKETRHSQLEDILHELERPLMIENVDREKHFRVYIVMRTYLFKMCDALEAYDNYSDYSIVSEDYRPALHYNKVTSIGGMPERLIFERFDEIWLDGRKLIQPDSKILDPVFPKPEILKGIPQEDTKMIYHTYFDIPIVENTKHKGGKDKPKDNKGKKEKGSKDKTDKGDEDKNKKGDAKVAQSTTRISTIKEGFDPYGEEYTFPKTDSDKNLKTSSQYSIEETECNYYRYLIVYTHLTEAIGAMVDTLETFKENIISFETLGELKKCTSIYPEKEMLSVEGALSKEVLDIEEVPTKKSEDVLYYEYLLDSHLNKNINTKKFIIHGHKRLDDEYEASTISALTEQYISRANVFRSHETIIESIYPSGSTSVGIQTSLIDFEFPVPIEQSPDAPLKKLLSSSSINTENTIGQSLSHDIFFFMDTSDEEEELSKVEKQRHRNK